jgi:excisionase family DNA binding protein
MNVEETQAITARLDRIERLTLIGAKNVLDIEETALLTGFTTGHLYRLTSAKQIPHYKKNRKLYFSKSEVEKWMLDRKVLTGEEIQSRATTYTVTHKRQ